MTSTVPAADQVLRVLRHLATQPGPVPAAAVARALDLPRSTTYHLLAVLRDQGFVTHLPEQRRYGLGVTAFEVGSAYVRHDPLEHLARPLIAALAHRADVTVHLGVLHGRETLYLLKEQPPHHPVLVTDIGVRLPAQLTASGRAVLAWLPPAQVRALFPSPAVFVDRTGRGPTRPSQLRRLLALERQRGWSEEDGYVTAGFASVAAAAFDHVQHPAAAIGATFVSASRDTSARADLAADVIAAATALTRRLGGRAARR
jgi:DNA-binding IclR family transcriptional regulator